MSSDTRTLRIVIVGDASSAERAMGSVASAAGTAEGKLSRSSGAFSMWAKAAGLALAGGATAAIALGVKTASGMEQAKIAFTNMLGSATKADAFLKQLADFAARTPFELPDLVKGSQRMMAMGIESKNVIPYLTAIGDAVAGMGGSAESIEYVTRAIGQMQAKGKVQADEILQLTEQGIPALKILADGYGVTAGQMTEMMKKGQVLSDKAIPILMKGLESGTKSVKGFGGMMAQQSQTVAGKFSTMKDTIAMGLGDLAKNAFPFINQAMTTLTDAAMALFAGLQGKEANVQGLAGAFNTLGQFLRNTAQFGWSVLSWMNEHRPVVIAVTAAVTALWAIQKAHAAIIFVTSGALKAHVAQMAIVKGATLLWTGVQWLLNSSLLACPVTWIVVAIGAIVAAIVYAYKNSETFRNAVTALWENIKKCLQWIGDKFSWLWNNAIRPAIRSIVMSFLDMVGVVIHGAANMLGWVPGVGPKLQDAAAAFDRFKGNVNRSLSGINDQQVTVSAGFDGNFKAMLASPGAKGMFGGSWSYRAYGGPSGPIGGAGSSTGDTVPTMLSVGEHVWSAREVAAAGGHGVVAAMRDAVLHLASGGPVRFMAGASTDSHLVPPLVSDINANARRAVANIVGNAVAAVNKAMAAMSSLTGGGPGGTFYYPFGSRRPSFPWGSYPSGGLHRALDFAVPVGTPVHAGIGGRVMVSGWDNTGFGYAIRTHDTDGNYTIYGHMSRLIARVGQAIARGMVIAYSGNTGRSTGPHTHVERRHILYDPSTSFRFDEGGMLPPGVSSVYNGLGRPERLINPDAAGGGIVVNLTVEGSVVTERDLIQSITLGVRDELLRHSHRNGGRTGLPGK